MLLENKVVLITGASRGIGRATAIEAARQGANVAINTYKDDAVAAEVVAEIEALGRKAIVVDA
ncbi:SDR family NAD(P)-dependent oxidoreductase, partial [Brevundimonas intermedia]|uniref:SDR family NAD(P)-dependent oxidoreductase n=1 Tax=Brevundimonas intermedia TaxID=74315 RepID=UPI0032089CFF